MCMLTRNDMVIMHVYVSLVVVGEGGGGHGMFHIEGERIAWRSTKFFCFFSQHICLPASGQPVVTGVVPSPPKFLP